MPTSTESTSRCSCPGRGHFSWSEEHLNRWLDEHPEYRELDQMPIHDFLEGRKEVSVGSR